MVTCSAASRWSRERGLQGGRAASGDQNVRRHDGQRYARRPRAPSGAMAVPTAGNPQSGARARPDGVAPSRAYGHSMTEPATHPRSPAADPPRSRRARASSGSPAIACGSRSSATRDELRLPAVRDGRGRSASRRRSASRSRGLAAERGFGLHPRGALRAVDAAAPPRRRRRRARCAYDALVLALGAAREAAIPGALTFTRASTTSRGCAPRSSRPARRRAAAGRVRRGRRTTRWTLPIYELALLTARWAASTGSRSSRGS